MNDDQPLDDQITVLDYSSMLYDVRKQRNELRAELNIIIQQHDALMLELQDMEYERDKYKKQWRDAVDALASFILLMDDKP
jgi:predicted  nucleic acid-binding Zn-ribbon protein